MKNFATAASLAAALLVGASAFAGPTPAPKASPAPKKPAAAPDLTCPVTHEKIASVKEAAGSTTYKGKTYYFCCAGCKPMFDKDPAKYVKTASATTSNKMSVKPAPKTTPAPAPKS